MLRGEQKKEWIGCLLDDLRAFGINADQRTTGAKGEGEWRKAEEQEGSVSWRNGSLQRKPGLDHGIQLYVSEHDGNDQREDRPEKACSSWFARES